MNVGIRFWNDCTKLVETHCYDSQFLHRPNADELFQSLLLSSQKLDEEKVLQLAVDEPNVNWKVLEKLDNHRIENDFTKTLIIGSCSQHIIHGAFQNDAPSNWNIDKILKAMYWMLHDSPARRDDCTRVGNTEIFPLRYILSPYLIFLFTDFDGQTILLQLGTVTDKFLYIKT